MELSYWQSRWKKGHIGFHMEDSYQGLKKHLPSLNINENSSVFVPLCGKSKDLVWLAEKCQDVVGVEISEAAVHQFLAENNLNSKHNSFADFKIFTAGNIILWCGDFFKLPSHKFHHFDLIFDKAAFVALPSSMRDRYEKKLMELSTEKTKILIHHFEYNQDEMNGPPFSVTREEINRRFGSSFGIELLESNQLDIHQFKKFQNRGLQSYFIEYLSLLLPLERK